MLLGIVRLEIDIHGMKIHLVALRACGTNATLNNLAREMLLSVSAKENGFR